MEKSTTLPYFENYTIQQELNSGFIGRTTLLRHKVTNKLYICKSWSLNFFSGTDCINSFLKRIEKVKKLNLPFVVSYNEIIKTEDSIYLIRPYIDCPTLNEHIQQNPNLDSTKAYLLWKIILKSVSILHQNDIYSLPIKLSNIFVYNERIVSIVDIYELRSDIHWVLQTMDPSQLLCLPPEFFDGSTPLTPSSDVWSLGVLLALISGATIPWYSKNIFNMIKKIQNPEIPLNLHPFFIPIIESIFKIDFNNRPTIESLLSNNLIPDFQRKRRKTDPVPTQPNSIAFLPQLKSPKQNILTRVQSNSPPPDPNFHSPHSTSSYIIRRRFIPKSFPFPKN